MNKVVFIFLLAFVQFGFSQTETCDCLANLSKIVQKTEENYAGFPTKKNADYALLVKALKQKAAGEIYPKKCFYILKTYIRFFKDKHFVLTYRNEKDFDNETITGVESYLETNKVKLSSLEGVWISADSSTKIGIKKTANGVFKGIVLESKDPKLPAGLVLITLTSNGKNYIAKEYNSFSTTDVPAKQNGNLLQIWNYAMFGKIYPTSMSLEEEDELATWKNNNNGLIFKTLSPKTAYLKITTFMNNDDKIQQLVAQNDATIRNTENLIVDLTGNGGGNTGWVAFLSYFMTNSIVQPSSFLRITPENVTSKLADLEPFVKNPIPNDYKKYFPDSVLNAYKQAYTELPTTQQQFYPIPSVSFPLDSVTKNPKRIALVADDFCGSSAEYFFFIAQKSKKTKTYGTHTIGMMDYEGMSNPTQLSCSYYNLFIPNMKSSWTDKNPIDQTGFRPQVLLNHIPQNKWLDFIVKDLEK